MLFLTPPSAGTGGCTASHTSCGTASTTRPTALSSARLTGAPRTSRTGEGGMPGRRDGPVAAQLTYERGCTGCGFAHHSGVGTCRLALVGSVRIHGWTVSCKRQPVIPLTRLTRLTCLTSHSPSASRTNPMDSTLSLTDRRSRSPRSQQSLQPPSSFRARHLLSGNAAGWRRRQQTSHAAG